MVLTYKFKKETLDNGDFVYRPRINVLLKGSKSTIQIHALINSGCDTTVIPEGIAKAVGLKIKGKKDKLYSFREYTNIIQSKQTCCF